MTAIALTPKEIAEYDRQWDVADKELCTVLDRVYEGKEDPSGVLFSLWCHLTQLLATEGWTGEELADQAHHHAASATTEGPMQ